MTLFSNWVELVITQDSGYFAKISAQLTSNGIVYKEKIQNIGHGNRRYGQLGALGESSKHANLYQIFVKKDQLERAKMLITRG